MRPPKSSQPVMEEKPMSDPSLARYDLCSIRTANEQDEPPKQSAAGSAPTATHWAAMTTLHP